MSRVRNSDIKSIRPAAAPFLAAVLTILLIFMNTGGMKAQEAAQKAYTSPQDAVTALVSALKTDDTAQVMQIFGPESKAIVFSGDPVADNATREKFLEKYSQMHRFVTETNQSVTLYIGAENWPFPIPLIKQKGAWLFDTSAGKKEILYRRIGRNEFDTLDTLHALVDAEKEYASEPRDGEQTKQYAQKLLSDAGKHNGLYWKTDNGQPASPVGSLIAEAFEEGYRKQEGPVPFHGYVYKLVHAQGANAPGGAIDYMVNGKLTRGFAFVAYPVEYRNSGVMTFVVNQDGKIYQKDLGPNTAATASSIAAFNPDKSWKLVE